MDAFLLPHKVAEFCEGVEYIGNARKLSLILMKVPKACKMFYSNPMKQFHSKISKISSLKINEVPCWHLMSVFHFTPGHRSV